MTSGSPFSCTRIAFTPAPFPAPSMRMGYYRRRMPQEWAPRPIWDVSHRPWPPPTTPWVMTQRWHDLLFAHWPVPEDVLRRVVPELLPIDTFNGQAWVGVVPFRMTDVRMR